MPFCSLSKQGSTTLLTAFQLLQEYETEFKGYHDENRRPVTYPSPVVQVVPLSWNSERDLLLSLAGVLSTGKEFLEFVGEFFALCFSAYYLDVDFRTASGVAFQRLTS
jgi:hypothetical protein